MSHKKKHSGGVGGVNLGLIITPMLDMSFQILAFFIMTYHPSALEGHIPGSLVPPEDFAKKSKDNVEKPQDLPSVSEDLLDPTLNEAVTIKVKSFPAGGTQIEGSPEQISIKNSLETEAEIIADLNQPKVTVEGAMKELGDRLKSMVKKGTTKANLKIAADGELRQQYVMMVYDTCKKAGFDKIHFVPPPVLNAKLK